MKNILLIFFSFLLFGCSSPKVLNGRYYDPTSTFSIDTVSSPFNLKIHEFSKEFYKGVSFTDDLGIQVNVEVVIIPEDCLSILLEKNADEKMELFDAFFRQGFSELVERYPEAFVKHEENLFLEDISPAKYFIFSIPGGSHLIDLNTMNRPDCTRGYLISVCDNHIIINTHQKSVFAEGRSSNFDDIKNHLIKMRLSYRDETVNL